jgi:hypothetical protein
MFSRQGRRLWQRLPRKLWHRVIVSVGGVVAAGHAAPEELRERVTSLYAASLPAL